MKIRVDGTRLLRRCLENASQSCAGKYCFAIFTIGILTHRLLYIFLTQRASLVEYGGNSSKTMIQAYMGGWKHLKPSMSACSAIQSSTDHACEVIAFFTWNFGGKNDTSALRRILVVSLWFFFSSCTGC